MTWGPGRGRRAAFWLGVVTAAFLLWSLGPLILAVPIGAAFALACRGWRSRLSPVGITVMFVVLAMPPIALGTAMWLLFAFPLRSVPFGEFGWFGTRAQIAGLTTMFLPLATLIVWLRLLFVDRHQEEIAADLHAPPGDVVRRVLLPQAGPAIAAAAAVVFAGSLAEFVVVQALIGSGTSAALGPAMFGAIEGPEPRFRAIGTTLALAGMAAFGLLIITFRGAFRARRAVA